MGQEQGTRNREQELPRQLTTDAVAQLLNSRVDGVVKELGEIRREQREDHNAVRQDIKELREVTGQALEEVRESAKTAADALRLATSNTSDIEALRKKQQSDDYALAVLPEGGGLRALVKRVLELGRTHEDAALVDGAKRGLLRSQAKGIVIGASVAGSVATAVAVVIERV